MIDLLRQCARALRCDGMTLSAAHLGLWLLGRVAQGQLEGLQGLHRQLQHAVHQPAVPVLGSQWPARRRDLMRAAPRDISQPRACPSVWRGRCTAGGGQAAAPCRRGPSGWAPRTTPAAAPAGQSATRQPSAAIKIRPSMPCTLPARDTNAANPPKSSLPNAPYIVLFISSLPLKRPLTM